MATRYGYCLRWGSYNVPELAIRLESLEKQAALAFKHDGLANNTRAKLKHVMAALRELIPTPVPKRRPIGLVHPKE